MLLSWKYSLPSFVLEFITSLSLESSSILWFGLVMFPSELLSTFFLLMEGLLLLFSFISCRLIVLNCFSFSCTRILFSTFLLLISRFLILFSFFLLFLWILFNAFFHFLYIPFAFLSFLRALWRVFFLGFFDLILQSFPEFIYCWSFAWLSYLLGSICCISSVLFFTILLGILSLILFVSWLLLILAIFVITMLLGFSRFTPI